MRFYRKLRVAKKKLKRELRWFNIVRQVGRLYIVEAKLSYYSRFPTTKRHPLRCTIFWQFCACVADHPNLDELIELFTLPLDEYWKRSKERDK